MAKKKVEDKKELMVLSEEEQPYKLPEGWIWTRLGDVVIRLKRGKSPKYIDKSNVLVFAQKCNQKNGLISLEKALYLDTERLSKYTEEDFLYLNDTVINSTGNGTLGRVGFFDVSLPNDCDKIVADSHVTVVRCNISIIFPKYAYWFLKNKQPVLELMGEGSTNQKELRIAALAEISFPLPSLEVQKKIVNNIESLFAKLDKVKEKVRTVLDGTEMRKSAILHKAFSGELTEKWRKENNVSFDSWQKLTLNDIADYKKGPFGSSITKAMFVPKSENTYKVYEQGNAIRKTINYGNYYITEDKYNELIGFSVQSSDIIISCAGTVGEVYKLPLDCEKGVINQALMRVRLYDIICEQFFIYYFGEILKGDIRNKSKGTAIVNIPPFKVMKAMEILLPRMAEQQEIVRLLDNFLTKEAAIKNACEQTLTTIDTMKQSILAKAFRGELGAVSL